MPRPQFTLRALLIAMLVVAAFLGGIRVGRDRQRREDLLAEQIAREKEFAAKAKEEARVEQWLRDTVEANKVGMRQRDIYSDKRWKIPGAIMRADGTFYRNVQDPHGRIREEPIPR